MVSLSVTSRDGSMPMVVAVVALCCMPPQCSVPAPHLPGLGNMEAWTMHCAQCACSVELMCRHVGAGAGAGHTGDTGDCLPLALQ